MHVNAKPVSDWKLKMQMMRRELKLSYVLFEKPYAWRCTLCSKLFVALSAPAAPDDLELVWKEFRTHSCWCSLSGVNLI